MTLLSSILFYLVAPLMAVLAYLHYSAISDEAERKRTKFNEHYDPAQTDCSTELPFTKPGVELVTLTMGLDSFLNMIQALPRSVLKAYKLFGLDLGRESNEIM